ncbi:MAG: hypothetical protein PVG12_11420 [Gammaproteobacteria bacterium]|jgi:hypothetical protein
MRLAALVSLASSRYINFHRRDKREKHLMIAAIQQADSRQINASLLKAAFVLSTILPVFLFVYLLLLLP